jgi:hypothetical protein
MEWLKSRASDTANWRRCLGESTVAARWLAEKEDFGRIVHLLDTPKQEIQDDRRPLRDPVGDSGLVRRHYYLQGRLCQLFGEPMEAEKRLNAYLKQSQDSGKWEDAAEAMSLLALTHLLHPLPQLGEHNESGASGVPDVLGRVLRWLRNDGSGQAVGEPAGSQRERFFNDALREALRKLAEQTALYRKHRDWTGVASSLGSQAVLFLELGNIQDAERLLMVRARLLVKRKIWQPLPRIDEGLGVSRDSGKRSYS